MRDLAALTIQSKATKTGRNKRGQGQDYEEKREEEEMEEEYLSISAAILLHSVKVCADSRC